MNTKTRIQWLINFFLVIFILLASKLFFIQIIQNNFYEEKIQNQRYRLISLSSPRGDILDRNGSVLATLIDVSSYFAVPHEVENKKQTAHLLSKILNLKEEDLAHRFNRESHFVWVSRKVDDQKAKVIDSLNLKGIHKITEQKRVYPKGRLASQLIGFCGIDNQGLFGLEIGWDKFLKGKEGKLLIEKDAFGKPISFAEQKLVEQPTPGMNLTLTIDETIQYITERELENAVKKNNANMGIAIVMDPKTNEILSMAGYPNYDPNQYFKYPAKNWQTQAVSWVYEPGSTFKVITTSIGVNEGLFKKDTRLKFLTSITVGGKVIENAHAINRFKDTLTVSEMLQESVNTGSVQVGLGIGPQKFYEGIRNFGFGESTDIGLPGESAGLLRHYTRWYKPDIAMMTFGQSIAVTPIQLITAYCAVANKGVLQNPVLIKKVESLDGQYLKVFEANKIRHAISEKAAKEVVEMMEETTTLGTGKRLKNKYFTVASKTGTAQKIIEGGRGYYKDRFVGSFMAFAPASNPRICVLVIIDNPRAGTYWGETTAGPALKKILDESLRYLNVEPDKNS